METRREEIQAELREIDEETYRLEDLRVIWEDQLNSPKESNRERAKQEIEEIDDTLQGLRNQRAQLQKLWDETPQTQAARRTGGQFGSFIRKLQREGRLPQD